MLMKNQNHVKNNTFYAMKWQEVHIPMRDGNYLAANLYQPDTEGEFPVLMTLGPYGKDVHYAKHNPLSAILYEQVQDKGPYVCCGTPNPEFWVSQGYAVVRIDQRGIGHSPGVLEVFSDTLKEDYYDSIEWSGTQPWSNGKVGLFGFSYYAITQWSVAQEQPPHLSCMVVWEGAPDIYSDGAYNGGILINNFFEFWLESNVLPRQYGKDTMSEKELASNRVDWLKSVKKEPLKNEWWKKRSADLKKVTVPILSAGNWFSAGFLARGNINGFLSATSENKWLEMHIGSHFVEFYNEDSRMMQKQFLDYWLKNIDTGLMHHPKIKYAMPEGQKNFSWQYGNEYPFKNTLWTKLYLDASSKQLDCNIPSDESKIAYVGDKERQELRWKKPMSIPFKINESNTHRVVFETLPLEKEMKIAGPIKLRLFASSSINDMDIFATLRNLAPDGKEVLNAGCYTIDYPVSQGWLRASLRKIDEVNSTEYHPEYKFDEIQKLIPNEIYRIDIAIQDSAMVFKEGHKLILEIGGQDQSGCSLLMHTSDDRVWDADVTLYTGKKYPSYLLIPVI